MTDKEQIKAIIKQYADKGERLLEEAYENGEHASTTGYWDGYGDCAKLLLRELDDMQEEPVSDDLEQAIDTYLATYFGSEQEKQNWPFLKKMAMYFVAWQKQKDSIPVSEDLEEAVNAYIGYAPEVDESSSTYGKRQAFKAGANWQKQQMERYRIEHCKSLTNEQAELESNFVSSHVEKNNRIPTFIDAIEYGIEYGKQQKDESKVLTEEQCRKIRDDAFELGKDVMKQQMMAKAVDTTVHIDAGGYPYIDRTIELYDYDKNIPLAKEGDKYKVILIKEGWV